MSRSSRRFAVGCYAGLARRCAGSRGQSLVELVLALPVVVLVCLGIVDFGRANYYEAKMAAAAQAGAQAAAVPQAEDARVKEAIRRSASPEIVGDTGIAISPDDYRQRVRGVTVTVRVVYVFTPMTPFIGSLFPGGQITISKSASAVVF